MKYETFRCKENLSAEILVKMDNTGADELFKDYFETFNSEDILADPICEASEEDPLQSLQPVTEEQLISGSDSHVDNIIDNVIAEQGDGLLVFNDSVNNIIGANLPGFEDAGDGNNIFATDAVNNIIKQEVADDHDQSPGPSSSAPSSGGLKIAGFAVDPDLCSIVEPEPPPAPLQALQVAAEAVQPTPTEPTGTTHCKLV